MFKEKMNEQMPWHERIPAEAKEKIFAKIKGANITDELKRKAMEAVEELLTDPAFMKRNTRMANWEKTIEKNPDAEEAEENLAKGLMLAIQKELEDKNIRI